MDSRHKLFTVKWLGQIIIRPEAKALDLVFSVVRTRQNKDRRVGFSKAQLAQHLVPVHIGQS